MFLFLSSFPELDKCTSSAKQIISAEESVIKAMESSATPAFEIYGKNQPEEMCNGLISIKEAYKSQYECATPVFEEIKTLPIEFEQLRVIHNDFMPQRKEKGLNYERHEIAKFNLTAAQNELNHLKQGNYKDQQIKEAELKLKKAEDEDKNYSNYDTDYEKKFLQYETNFMKRISQPLERISKKWAESSRSISELADKFEEPTHTFQLDKTDQTLDKLESILLKIDEQLQNNSQPLVDPNTLQVSSKIQYLVSENDSYLAA
ncbi:hypothetical protein M9Y10_043512 [Tritrichomonas musculus]|uniref:BAR domain-containing protein n=1 Tax=Tritrichomonas musculus TaxID=1915356 RepID=A0ABR2K1Q7_9EUKA